MGLRIVAVLTAVVLALVLAPPAGASPRPAPLPDDFLWGVASSGFQSEGSSPDSNWTRYIRRGETADPIGTSVDFRHRYREDVALAKGLGVEVYRVGVEWARVEPRPGVIDRHELAYYDDLVQSIVDAGMRPMITLDHWVYPGWIADRGGWAWSGTPAAWLRHNTMIVDRYTKYHPLWITINEPTVYVQKELQKGGITPDRVTTMLDRLVRVHRTIYDRIHRRDPNAMVSSNIAYLPTVEPLVDEAFAARVADRLDFVGVDYYYSVSPTDLSAANAAVDRMWDASMAADGIYYALRDLHERFPGKPLYVVEAGMVTENGKPRRDGYRRDDHLRDLVYWMQRARADGMPLIGFNYWTLTDNYEWGNYASRFGLYTVDVKTDPSLTRRPTAGVAAYRAVTATNGVGPSYRPSRPATWCSLVSAPSSCAQPVRN
ncbi:family 1 glycosylhydrolase [Gordonia sp. HY002]|uniref:family 1 glycosylhydrolase n=1 Tax=Gordonia zhenghanii TaxID=2911516 RepID=UPI001EEFAE6E|nr:family 1 glycosylhydrolase [Gordonia zhenghanii]MCF8571855.1 family 1 glycosylhydrolase [Gordonia zhenghanii]MCF8604432.1 family 1 glycosylhydrolase [Gordonia zhenghanii]